MVWESREMQGNYDSGDGLHHYPPPDEETPLMAAIPENDKAPVPLQGLARFEPSDSESERRSDTDGPWSPRPNRRDRSLSNVSEILEEVYERVAEAAETVKEEIVEATETLKEEFVEILETEIQPVKPRDQEPEHFPFAPHGVHPKLSVIALSILVFYKVSGGPFGCEPTVRAAGPFYALLGFIIFPVVWSIPEALVTAELGSLFPEPSGSVAWIEEAFGSTAGLLCGYFHWVSGATDNAIYPALFLEYLSSYFQSLNGNSTADEFIIFTNIYWNFALCSVMTIVLAYVNWRGLEIVGNLSVVVAVLAMSPFVLLVLCGASKVDPRRWLVLPLSPELMDETDDDALKGETFFPAITLGGIIWRPFVNNLFWNLNSFDVGTYLPKLACMRVSSDVMENYV